MRAAQRLPAAAGRFRTVADMVEPVGSGHRGAGADLVPENTMEAVDAAYAMGLQEVNVDAYLLSDGTIGLSHDSTVDRTTTGTGNMSSFSSTTFKALTVDAGSWFGGGWGNLSTALLSEVWAKYAGKIVLCIESTSAPTTDAIVAIAQASNLQKAIIVGARGVSQLTAAVAAGIPTEYIDDQGAIDPATLTAAGIQYVTLAAGEVPNGTTIATAARAQQYVDAGLKVRLHTITRRCQITPYAGVPIAAYEADEPIYALHDPSNPKTLTYRRTTDPFSLPGWPHGLLGPDGSSLVSRGTVGGGKLLVTNDTYILQGWGCPLAGMCPGGSGTTTITTTFTWEQASSDSSRWANIVFGARVDRSSQASGSLEYFNYLTVRQTGALELGKFTAGSAVTCPGNLNAANGVGTFATGDSAIVTVTMTPTQLVVSVTKGATTKTITWNDTTHRGMYFYYGMSTSTSNPALKVSLSNVTITN